MRYQPTEFEECLTLIDYLKTKNLKFAHIHQEMWTTSWKQKNRAKALGVKAGLPDYMIVLPNKLLFIEMKRKTGGRLTKYQKEWLEVLNNLPNIKAKVCKGFDEAKNFIENNLEN